MSGRTRQRVALLGSARRASAWLSALGEWAHVCPPGEEVEGKVDAVVIAPGVADPFARTKEALLRGLPVLYAAPFLLNPWQARRLSELSRHHAGLLRYAEPFQHRAGFAFLRRLLDGREPFWRPLYLRALWLAEADRGARIDELATELLACCAALLGGEPQSVTAAAVRRSDAGDLCAAFLVLQHRDAPLVQCTVSLAEGTSARQLVAVTPTRTVIFDDLDPVATVRIAGGQEGGAVPDERCRAERLLVSAVADPLAQEAKHFLAAAAAGDRSADNSERWSRVATLWWAARQSMSFGGVTEVPVVVAHRQGDATPPLTVIEGGGGAARAARSRPALTVVGR